MVPAAGHVGGVRLYERRHRRNCGPRARRQVQLLFFDFGLAVERVDPARALDWSAPAVLEARERPLGPRRCRVTADASRRPRRSAAPPSPSTARPDREPRVLGQADDVTDLATLAPGQPCGGRSPNPRAGRCGHGAKLAAAASPAASISPRHVWRRRVRRPQIAHQQLIAAEHIERQEAASSVASEALRPPGSRRATNDRPIQVVQGWRAADRARPDAAAQTMVVDVLMPIRLVRMPAWRSSFRRAKPDSRPSRRSPRSDHAGFAVRTR